MTQLSQFLKTAVEVTDTDLPMFFPNDGWIDNGTEFLFDFRRSSCWPGQEDPAVGNNTLLNMVPGKANGIVVKTGSNVTFREGGFAFAGVAGNYITIGGTTDFRLPALGNPDVLYMIWIKIETGFLTGNFQNYLGRGTSTSPGAHEFRIGSSGGGAGILTNISNGTVSPSANANQTITDPFLNTTMQLALACENGFAKLFINGALISQSSTALTKPYADVNNAINCMQGMGSPQVKALVKRIGMTKLDQDRTAAERVLQDWNANHTALNIA